MGLQSKSVWHSVPLPNLRHAERMGYRGAVGGKWNEHSPRTDLGLNDLWTKHQLGSVDEFLSLLLYLKKTEVIKYVHMAVENIK